MIDVRTVAEIRQAEEAAFAVLPEGTLMQRAATALAVSCARLLTDVRGGVVGARIVLLVGSGNNGGDALYSGAQLVARGARVTYRASNKIASLVRRLPELTFQRV